MSEKTHVLSVLDGHIRTAASSILAGLRSSKPMTEDHLEEHLAVLAANIAPLLQSDAEFSNSLSDARRLIAEEFIETWNFPDPVEGLGGWEVFGDIWSRSVFLYSDGETSTKHTVRIEFQPDSDQMLLVEAPEPTHPPTVSP